VSSVSVMRARGSGFFGSVCSGEAHIPCNRSINSQSVLNSFYGFLTNHFAYISLIIWYVVVLLQNICWRKWSICSNFCVHCFFISMLVYFYFFFNFL